MNIRPLHGKIPSTQIYLRWAKSSLVDCAYAALDVTRAIRSSKQGQMQKAELDKEYKEAKASLDLQEKAIKTAEDRYHFKMSVASAQKKINTSENQKVAPLLEYIRSATKKIAERDGFDKVVESEPKKEYPDITSEIIQALDQL